ncbi:MAG: sulfatase-like hydrolase/transferase [Bacteroidales bacterium]
MNIKTNFNYTGIGLATVMMLPAFSCQSLETIDDLPNILWIVSEDNSAYFTGCYGNPFATTPNLDRMASEGFMYTHAYANCPVCAPARNTIITGVYAASNGNEHMRSNYPKSDKVRTYPDFLREAGYYCTNNAKTDYNFLRGSNDVWLAMWDESSNEAHYRNREDGQPFFAIFNLGVCHESSIHKQTPVEELRHDPNSVILPPYHPDTPEMRHDWAQYYDKVEDMDTQVGEILRELEERGEAENTIVFYYGDHGGVLARSKRFVYETGTHVPFIIRIPEKYKHLFPSEKPGDEVNRLVSFVDLAPTLLSLVGVAIPDFMQGDAFLGSQKTVDPEYAFMTRQRMDERYDNVRSIRDSQFRYIRNYMPFRISIQYIDYLFRAPSAQSWLDAIESGLTNEVQSRFFLTKPVEELYDTENDPWEVNNLADNLDYADIMDRMRNALKELMIEVRDVGLVPETEYALYAGDASMYDYMRSNDCPFDELIEASQLATTSGAENIDAYIEFLKDDHSAIRYWGATGLLIQKKHAGSAVDALKEAAMDESAAVATLVAEALYELGYEDEALVAYSRILTDSKSFGMTDRNFALNSIDAINIESKEIIAVLKELYKSSDIEGFQRYSQYDILMSEYLLRKWGVSLN